MLRVALAGAGMVSRHHLLGWAKLEDARVVAIADPERANAERRAADYVSAGAPPPTLYDDIGAMLDAERPDALDIATPMATHAAMIEAAAERGVATLCQKPLAPTVAEASAAAASAEGRIRLMVHENWRFRPYYRRIAEWIAAGRIGAPRAFRLDVIAASLAAQPEGAAPSGLSRQPFLARMERLIVLELLVHHLDTLRYLMGEVAIEAASLMRLSPHVVGEDTAVVQLAAGEAKGAIFASMAAVGQPPRTRDGLLILGEAGSISLEGERLRCAGLEGETVESFDLEAAYQQSYDNTVAHFAACLRSGAPFETPPSVHLAALAAVEEIYRLAG